MTRPPLHRPPLSRPGRQDPARTRRDLGVTTAARRVAAAAGILLLTLATAGCSDPTTAPPTTSPEITVADPETVLEQLGAQLRTRLDALTADLDTTYRGTTGDDSGVCDIPVGTNRWPRQWDYSQRLFLTEPDSRPVARRLADELRAEGWAQRTNRDDDTVLRLILQKDGAVVFIGAGTTDGAMVVNGTSACVNADGTVDHRPVE